MGRDHLPKALEEAGARVDVVPTYQTVVPENFDRGRLSAMLAGSGDCIAFTSPSTIKNLAKLFDTHDLGKVLPGVVDRMHRHSHRRRRRRIRPARRYSTQQLHTADLAQAIANYYSNVHRRNNPR